VSPDTFDDPEHVRQHSPAFSVAGTGEPPTESPVLLLAFARLAHLLDCSARDVTSRSFQTEQLDAIDPPVCIIFAFFVGALERIPMQVDERGHSIADEPAASPQPTSQPIRLLSPLNGPLLDIPRLF
jgi:hypothetical protein